MKENNVNFSREELLELCDLLNNEMRLEASLLPGYVDDRLGRKHLFGLVKLSIKVISLLQDRDLTVFGNWYPKSLELPLTDKRSIDMRQRAIDIEIGHFSGDDLDNYEEEQADKSALEKEKAQNEGE